MESSAFLSSVPKLRFHGFGLHPSQFGSPHPKHRASPSEAPAQSRPPHTLVPSLRNQFLRLPQDLSSSLLLAKQFDGIAIRTKRQASPRGVSCARDGSLVAPPVGAYILGKFIHRGSRSAWFVLPPDTALPRSWKQGRKMNESLLEHQLSRSCRCRGALRDGSRVTTAAQDFLYEKGTLLLRAVVFVGTVFLLGIATLYGQAKAQSYVQKHILPPVGAMVGAYLGRNLDLGKVQRVSPLGLTLESCSIGPHEEEFSCGALPNVEIRIRPFASIQRRQIVVDAVLVQPNLLVSQRKDWTWLGIPTPMEKSFHRTSSEEGLDARTKARRLSRERISAQLAEERHQAARRSVKLGYILQNGQINGEDSTAQVEEMRRSGEFGTAVAAPTTNRAFSESVDDGPIRAPIKPSSRRHNKALFEGDWYGPERGGLENEENYQGSEEECAMDEALVFGRSLVDCRTWLDKYFVKPVRLFKHWSEKSSSQRSELRRRNLDLSAAAARAYFDKIDNTRCAEESGGGQQEKDLERIKDSPKPSVIANQDVLGAREDCSDANSDGNLSQMKIIRVPLPDRVTQNSGHMEEFPTNNSLNEGYQDAKLSEEDSCCLEEKSRWRDLGGFSEEPQENWKSEESLEGDNDCMIQTNTEEDYGHSTKGVIIQEELVSNSKTGNIHGGKSGSTLKEQFATKDSMDNVCGKKVGQTQSTSLNRSNAIFEEISKEGLHRERLSSLQPSVGKLTVPEDAKRSIHEVLVNAIRDKHLETCDKGKHVNSRIYDNAEAIHLNQKGDVSSCFEGQIYDGAAEGRMTCSLETPPKDGGVDDEIPRAMSSPNLGDGATAVRNNQWSQDNVRDSVLGQNSSEFASLSRQPAGIGIKSRAEALANKLVAQAKRNLKAAPLQKWLPVTLETVYFRGGTLMLLAYGDQEPRVVENINGYLKLGNKYEQINVHVAGRLKEWRSTVPSRDGGKILVKVFVDVRQQKWHVKLKGHNLHAPLLERLLEIPVNWSTGRANGELHIWATKGEQFPNFSGRLNVNNLGFQIWEAPSSFKEVSGTLFFQGQRMFLHNTSGFFGAIPLNVSGDMDLNPEYGEYRLVCQVSNVEVNALMKTLKAQPPLFPLAGALKAAVYCRGPLEVPLFAGSAEISKKDMDSALYRLPSVATEAIRQKEDKGAVAAFDRIPFSYASANFTFDTDNCIADLYGIRATLADGGEIRGAGNMWICPEGELDSTAVNIDLSGQVLFDSVMQNYLPVGWQVPPVRLDFVHGEAKVRGSLLRPVFDIKWNAPDAKGSFNDVRGDINVSHEAIIINSSALTFDLWTKIHTLYPPLPARRENRLAEYRPPAPPKIEGLEFDVKMRGFDFLGLAPSSALGTSSAIGGMHMKVTGRAKFQGRVVKLPMVLENDLANGVNDSMVSLVSSDQSENATLGILGEILLSGLRLNQLLVAPHLTGSLDIFPSSFKLNALGRADEHLLLEFSSSLRPRGLDNMSTVNISSTEARKNLVFFSLERGQLRTNMHYEPGHSAKLEVRNLQLDELELASLRGVVQKAEMQLNFQKRRGQGSLSVRRPRFSGVQGESLDLSCRWSGDVITIERSLLEQASSRYELQGEYVLPGPRDHVLTEKERGDGAWKSAMAGQLGSLITSMGRWRLRLEVPGAEVADMLPVARLLLRSSDPAVVSRSKELFMQGMQHAGFFAEDLKQQLENVRISRVLPAPDEGSPESIPLPGLAELKGHWHGTFDASGGGNGDTSADFDFYGDEWEWGTYKTQRVIAVGSYGNNGGLRLEKIFIQKDTATLHADGTLLGPKSNLHFAVLNFPVGLVPPLLQAVQSSTLQPVLSTPLTSIRGILYMEGDLRGPIAKPQCDVQIRLLDGAVGGIELGRAEVVASITSSNRLLFNANFEPAVRIGHVHVKGSLPMAPRGVDVPEDDETQRESIKLERSRSRIRDKSRVNEDNEADDKRFVRDRLGDEGWEVQLAEGLRGLDWDFAEQGAVQVDAAVKDGGMMLITALSPYLNWIQGNADLTLQVRGTTDQPTVDGVAAFHKVSISSPVLPRPLSNFGGTIRMRNNQLCVEGLDGRVGRKGRLQVKGKLPLKASEMSDIDNIELKADLLEVRAKNVFSGQVDSQMQFTGSLLEPEVSGMIKLSHGEAYLPQDKGASNAASTLASSLQGMAITRSITGLRSNEATPLTENLRDTPTGTEDIVEEEKEQTKPQIAVRLRGLKLHLGPELRLVYPLILNFAVSGDMELNGLADPHWIKPKGTLTFENGDVNLVATQVRLNRDHPNRAKFEPEQGLDPSLDLALVGADWQLKIQGRARNWQNNLVITSSRSGEPDALTRTEAARVFENQLAGSLLEGDGQLAFKKLAAATVETLMPKIEGKGEFGQARWRLVSAPQIPNLLSLDPTSDPFKSLANLSFGTEVEVQLGKRLQASVVRQLKESEMATQWTLLYQLNNKLRILFSSIPSVDNRLLFEYSATSQS